jgi:hypothetical protein
MEDYEQSQTTLSIVGIDGEEELKDESAKWDFYGRKSWTRNHKGCKSDISWTLRTSF